MKRRALPFLAGLFTLVGCGPSLQSLVQAKHYREAVCAGFDGSDGDRDSVGRALDKDADLLIHMHVVSSDELRPVLQEKTAAAVEKARILRVNVQSNILPVDKLEITGSLVTPGGQTAAIQADWPTLAWLTHEQLPPKRLANNYLTGMNLLKGTAAVFTVGLSLFFTEFHPEQVEVDAPLWEFERSAPLAAALHRTAGHSGCTNLTLSEGAGQRCSWFFVLDTMSRNPVGFDVGTRYVSFRQTNNNTDNHDAPCVIQRHARLPLGYPQEIEKKTRDRFAAKMIPLRSIVATD